MTKLAYQSVYEQLRQDIKDGIYPVNSLLPNEGELEEKYHVSRTTLRKAIKILVDKKLIEVRQGRGTMVLDRKAIQSYNHVTSVTETLLKRGYKVEARGLFIDEAPRTEALSAQLQLSDKDKIVRIQRVQCADNIPVAIMTNYIPESLVPGILECTPKFDSLYRYLEEEYHFSIDRTEDLIYAGGCSFFDAQILQVRSGTPLMEVERLCYLPSVPGFLGSLCTGNRAGRASGAGELRDGG